MVYLCQLGKILVIGSEDSKIESRQGFIIELYDLGNLENKVMVTQIKSFIEIPQ